MESPNLTYLEFFQRLNREKMHGPLVGRKDRWREVKLTPKSGHVTFAEWRNFKASMDESLLGVVDLPTNEDLRDHVLKQLPSALKEVILREEANVARTKFLVFVGIPPLATRGEILAPRISVPRVVGTPSGFEPTPPGIATIWAHRRRPTG